MAETPRADGPGRTALVTGASRGIGYELTRLFASDGYDVVLVARSRERLERVGAELEDAHGVTATVVPQDLSTPGAAAALHETVSEEGIRVDALVNNAAFGTYGRFVETAPERDRELIRLNLLTVTELTKLFAREMVERGEGEVLNVSSLAGVLPVPRAAVYAAVKSYLLSFSVAVADELEADGVTVSVLCPRETDTDILERGGVENSALPEKDLLDPAAVARSGYEGVREGRTVVVPGGLREKLLHRLPGLLPETVAASTARRYFEEE